MTQAEALAEFVSKASYYNLSQAAREQLKLRVLDALGCAIGALEAEPIKILGRYAASFAESGPCTLIGGGKAACDRAAFFNSALVRYLDYNDGYLSKGETCHPSDNLGAVLAASEFVDGNGKNLLSALAVAYEVLCRLCEAAPLRSKGFDHVTQGAYALAAGLSKALRLSSKQAANAVAVCGAAYNALRVTRTGALSNWKGLAYPNAAFGCVHATFLAMRGITGPLEVFEGNKGFMDAIAGSFRVDWADASLERVRRTLVKKYDAEIHSQSAIEALLDLKERTRFRAEEVKKVEVEIFDVAYKIIGSGEEGDKSRVRNKEEADHSLPYVLAAAILDGEVGPRQYEEERIRRADVQDLLKKVEVRPLPEFSHRFPSEMPCRITLTLGDHPPLVQEKRDYEGFPTRPMGEEAVTRKFMALSRPFADERLCREIMEKIMNLENVQVADLMETLAKVRMTVA